MSYRGGLVRAFIVGAVMSGAGLVSTDAFAQCCQGGSATGANAWTDGLSTSDLWAAYDAAQTGGGPLAVKAEPVPYWWTHGELEVGGRDFLNDPTRGGLVANGTGGIAAPGTALGANSLAKYYEYGIVAPGAFGGGHVATGSSDGLYEVDLWANNVGSNFEGFSDQSYLLTASKVGEQYFSASWDQTPHIYSTSAQTPYLGVGTNNLTLPAGAVSSATNNYLPIDFLRSYLQPTDIGIQRNTAAVSYRVVDAWTSWDAGVDYSYMTRKGTQVQGVVGLADNDCIGGGATPPCVASPHYSPTNIHGDFPVEVPAPIDDVTQNFGANGEYLGTSPWGQKFTVKVAYNGSLYTDNISNYTVESPYGASCPKTIGGTGTAGITSCPSAQLSTPPSNAANGFSETSTADLPFQSRYVGTTSYVLMTQNAAFLPMTNNPNAQLSPNGVSWGSVGALPATSLSGDIHEILSNSVITTQITPTLTSKLSYKYYDFDNQTPQIIQPCWISLDGTGVAPTSVKSPCGASGFENTISSLSISYIKQDAGAELTWRPTSQWNFNAAYGYERYDYTEADAGYTNENSVKGSVDWKPTSWLMARASGSYADRIAGDYSYLNNVEAIQFPTVGYYTHETGAWIYSSAYQQFMFDNRQQTKANFLLDLVVLPGVTVSPSVKYKDDNYGLNPLIQYGLSDSKMFSTGVDVAWVVTPTLSIVVSYYYEYYDQLLYNTTEPPASRTPNPQILVTTTDQTYVNTVTAAVRWAAIPNTLDFDARYEYQFGVDAQNCPVCSPAYPNDTTNFQRVDVTATYKFDPSWVHQMGFKGDLLARLRYTWESNAVSNWQNDSLMPLMSTASGLQDAIWLAYDNPNYNVQMISASLVARW